MKLVKHYLNNYYGRCKLKKCECINPNKPRFGEWVGTLCPDWEPFQFVNCVDDLVTNMKMIREIMEGQNDKKD